MGRRPKLTPAMKPFSQEIANMTLDELNSLRVEIGRQHAIQCEAASVSRGKLDTIKAAMFALKHGGNIGISDHALLRYMERHKGIDVRAIRHELASLAKGTKTLIDGEQGHFLTSDGVVVVIPQGDVMATVLPAKQTDALNKGEGV